MKSEDEKRALFKTGFYRTQGQDIPLGMCKTCDNKRNTTPTKEGTKCP
ncbi:hypothetical protein JZ785_13600 [Alicyclobacillus curvatus]|nr:hypothetical protein JZ785_13600 [Alicyclobacillus curvatus]